MLQKSNYEKVMEIFFKEPTQAHFIREISKRIPLAQTSVKKYIMEIEKEGMIIKRKTFHFDGFLANRDNEKFLFYKRAYNLISLFEVQAEIARKIAPKAIILFGSYQRGEDIEESDIDLLVISKVRDEISLKKYEKDLLRNIHITFAVGLEKLDENIRENVKKGWVIYGQA